MRTRCTAEPRGETSLPGLGLPAPTRAGLLLVLMGTGTEVCCLADTQLLPTALKMENHEEIKIND